MDFKYFFTVESIFKTNIIGMQKFDLIFFYFGLISILVATIFKIAEIKSPTPVDAKVRASFFSIFLSLGIGELIWSGFRYENISFFGIRFLALLILFLGFVWLMTVFLKIFKTYSLEKDVWEKEQIKQKYLPH